MKNSESMSINLEPNAACVLIADSLQGMRAYAAKIVRSVCPSAVNIVEAADGNAVLELTKEWSPDLVIMDVAMPVLNGIKAAAEIWRFNPRTKILFWTQYHREVYVRDLGRIVPAEAIHGYVLKNQADDKLRYAIQAVWMHDNPYIDPHVRESMRPSHTAALSDIEFETLQDLALGLTEKAISMRRHISVRGVQCRTAAIYNKLLPGKKAAAGDSLIGDVFNPRARMFFEAIKRGLVEPDALAAWEQDLDAWLRSELGIHR